MNKILLYLGGMWTTERFETNECFSIAYLHDKMRIYGFFHSFYLNISWLRHSNSRAGSVTENTQVVPMTEFISIEKHVYEVYIRNNFIILKNMYIDMYVDRNQVGITNAYIYIYPYKSTH